MHNDITVVTANFELVRRRADHVVKYFYAHLFAANPELRTLFPAEMNDQFERLFSALGHLVAHLDNPTLPDHLAQLGRDHRKFEVTAEHYEAVGRSLVAAMRFGSGRAWTRETEASWNAVYTSVATSMIRGAREARLRQEPRWWDATVLHQRLYQGRTAIISALPDQPYPYRAGQYATLQLPGLPRVWRPYSLARAPRGDGILEFHVARVKGGRLSNALCDRLTAGERLRLGPASGTATAPRGAGPVTLLAAGSGWSSVKAVLEELATRRPPHPVRLELVARAREHFYDPDTVAGLDEKYPWLEVSWWYPRPGEPRVRAARRLHAALLARGDWEAQHVYLSGPRFFVSEISELLSRQGVTPDRISHDRLPPTSSHSGPRTDHAEHFLAPRPAPWIDPDARADCAYERPAGAAGAAAYEGSDSPAAPGGGARLSLPGARRAVP
ncbi:globin domain-containing protein [Streptomyces sp. N2-109]|uniref:nitric oxide dioxygenase n=1 Tax=Streptomyces gossypii TaxID=2883101 RepID=A0ABT2K2N4_9ACTN|nr:globin domain-containing protein [Streptomyces gossypii]MCT2593899.1 globin domain-containing protein [Streptomyces gossypii]